MTDPARIEFPCAYPVRIIGEADAALRADVLAIVRRHAPDLDEATISVRDSREGSYRSVRVTIVATGKEQLEMLHAELMAHPRVRMVL
jgi:uncharacterized protein